MPAAPFSVSASCTHITNFTSVSCLREFDFKRFMQEAYLIEKTINNLSSLLCKAIRGHMETHIPDSHVCLVILVTNSCQSVAQCKAQRNVSHWEI